MEDYVNKTVDLSFYEPVKIKKFTIPIVETKKWWQFWKKSENKKAKKAIKELMAEFKKDIDFSCTDVKIP